MTIHFRKEKCLRSARLFYTNSLEVIMNCGKNCNNSCVLVVSNDHEAN